MVELVGDRCEPSDFVVPKKEGIVLVETTVSGGYLFLSGGKLIFNTGAGAVETITSA